MTSESIGGNIHYPDVEDRTSVAFTWSSKRRYRLERLRLSFYVMRMPQKLHRTDSCASYFGREPQINRVRHGTRVEMD